MIRYQFTPQATSDLANIWAFIAQDSREAADRVEEAVFAPVIFLLIHRFRDVCELISRRFLSASGWCIHIRTT